MRLIRSSIANDMSYYVVLRYKWHSSSRDRSPTASSCSAQFGTSIVSQFRKTKHLIQFRCAPLNRLTNRITSAWLNFVIVCAGFLKFSEHEAAKIGTLAERLGIRHNSAVELITAKSEGPSKEPRVHA